MVQTTLEPEVTTQPEPTVQPTVEPEPEPTLQQPTPETVQEPTNGAPDGPPDEPPELLRRSTRNRKQFQQSYEPSFSGTKYETACAQLVEEGIVHPDMHSFFQKELWQQPPEVVAIVMTQLSLSLSRWV